MNELADLIKRTAFKITRMGQLVGSVASERLQVPFGIVDLSLGAYACGRRFGRLHPRRDGPGNLRRLWNDRLPGHAQ